MNKTSRTNEDKTTQPKAKKAKQTSKPSVKRCGVCKTLVNRCDFPSDPMVCLYCRKDFGCDDCWTNSGMACGKCETFICGDCNYAHSCYITICAVCPGIFCTGCASFKPYKDRMQMCLECQPAEMKGKPRCDFCVVCGSHGKDAQFCDGCHERICTDCPSTCCTKCKDMFFCERCCPDGEFCDECEEKSCLVCCPGHREKGENDDEEEDDEEEES